MFKNGIGFIGVLVIFITMSSCSGYEKLMKSDDFDAKYLKAREYYNEGNYAKALPLLEQMLSVKTGTKEEEEIRYFIAYCHYGQSEYLLSGSLFKSFWLNFPRSYRAEECLYMAALSMYNASPEYELDQTFSIKALEAFQFFADTYKNSERLDACNTLMDELRKKQEQKMYASANLYFDMESYKAAAVTFENMLKEYPETSDAEYIQLLIMRAYFNYAGQSIVCKKPERYDMAINAFQAFSEKYPEGKYLDEAQGLYKRSIALKEKAIKESVNYNCNE